MRTPRKLSESDIYHVIVRGTGRQLIFEDDLDRRRFLHMLSNALAANGTVLYAWCLMGNHVHLLMRAPMQQVSACMKQCCGQYARYFNDKAGRVGHLFQERFKSEPIDDEAYLLTVIRYIHENPEKAGIATLANYPWSSYQEYVGQPRLCATDWVLDILGSVDEFVAFHHAPADGTPCLEAFPTRSKTKVMPDAKALELASDVLEGAPVDAVKSMARGERDRALARLKSAGLSIRQIERLTGIGRNTIARAE